MASPSSATRIIFDCHLHIVDHAYPLTPNQGYIPEHFPLPSYLDAATPLGVNAGAVVSGSFHAFDQTYLIDTLAKLGGNWVGVAQVPFDVSNKEIEKLDRAGVRACRFNLFRGRVESVDELCELAERVHRVAGWHAEIYADAATLEPHLDKLIELPQLVLDHMGMTSEGLPTVLQLVDTGCKIKASGFGRIKFDVRSGLQEIFERDPSALVFGTDMPSTRAPRPFQASDIELVEEALGTEGAQRVFWDNAAALYRPKGLLSN